MVKLTAKAVRTNEKQREMKIEDINIGDRIYESYMDYIIRALTVDRKTKKWIICRDERFVISNGNIEPYYNLDFPKCAYEIETKELVDRFDKQKLIRKVERSYWDVDLEKLTVEELNKLYQLMEEFKVKINHKPERP